MVTNSDKIQSEDYNQLRTNTSAIYVTQWGQSMRSVNVADSDTIQASHLDLVFKDIQSVNVHQVGSVNAGNCERIKFKSNVIIIKNVFSFLRERL